MRSQKRREDPGVKRISKERKERWLNSNTEETELNVSLKFFIVIDWLKNDTKETIEIRSTFKKTKKNTPNFEQLLVRLKI